MNPPGRDLPILDNHMHLDPSALHLKAVQRFEKAGGTHIIVSHKPYDDLPVRNGEDYVAQFQRTLDMVGQARANTHVKAYATVGPYPVDYLYIQKTKGAAAAKVALMKGMDIAQGLVLEGKAIAIGEIGRPHFPVPAEVVQASNEIMQYGMQLAKEAGCPVVLHTESPAHPAHMLDILKMSRMVGLEDHKVVKHFSPANLADPKLNHGATPSIIARQEAVVKALRFSNRFLMETDYMDSLERPDAVLPPEAIPELTKRLIENGSLGHGDADVIHRQLPTKVYGADFEI